MKHTKTVGSITYGYEADTAEEVAALVKAVTFTKDESKDYVKEDEVSHDK